MMDSLITTQTLKVRQTYVLRKDTGFLSCLLFLKKHLSFVLFFYFSVALTAGSLVYVDLQLQIVEVSYELRQKEISIRQLKMNNNDIYSQIARYQSFDSLNDQKIMAGWFDLQPSG